MKVISPTDFVNALGSNPKAQIVDVREPYEFEICCIKEHCINIPMGNIIEEMNKIDRESTLYLICKSGKRASAVANLLCTQYCFTDVNVLEGGIEAYMKITQPNYEIY